MTHSHKVMLCFVIALFLAALSTFLLLRFDWWQQLLSVDIEASAIGVGLFALKFLFLFDFLVIMVEGVSTRAIR